MSLSKDTRISHVHLRVKNMERALSFYRQLLGFNEVTRYDSTVALSATGQLPFQILLTESPNATDRPARSVGLFHTAIRFPDRRELGKTLVRLVQHGYALQGAADHEVSEAIYLVDPDGNGVELYCDRPEETWRWKTDEVRMVTEPLDVEFILAAAKNDEWNGIHPLTQIGHIHLSVSNLEKADEFYHQMLGFDVTSRSYPGALFMSAGGYHHHIGANVWMSRNGARAPENSIGLISFGIALTEPDLQSICGRFHAKCIEGVAGDDKTTLVDRDGIVVELATL